MACPRGSYLSTGGAALMNLSAGGSAAGSNSSAYQGRLTQFGAWLAARGKRAPMGSPGALAQAFP